MQKEIKIIIYKLLGVIIQDYFFCKIIIQDYAIRFLGETIFSSG